MKLGKILSVLAIVIMVGVFAISQSVYAVSKKQKTPTSVKKAEERLGEKTRKGSIYDAVSFMIENGNYEPNAITRIGFQEKSGINPATGEPYSNTTISREIRSSVRVRLLIQDKEGLISVPAGINHDVLDAINAEVEKIIPRKEAGTDRALGLRGFNLADLGEDKLKAIANIIEQAKLKNQAAVNIVAFESEFAQSHGEVLLNIVKELRKDQIPVIINTTGGELILIPELKTRVEAGEIRIEVVEPNSAAATQFRELFSNQKYVGLEGDMEKLKKAIQEGEVKG